MDHAVLIESFSEFKDSKNIDRATLMSIMEDVFRAMVRKKYGEGNNVDVVINTEKGDVEMYRNRTIVEDGMVEDENTQIALSDALKIESDFEVGEDVTEQIHLEDFGRRAVLSARQNLVARIMELEKESIYQKYKDRVGEIITGEVYQAWKKEILVIDDEGNELILPKSEQIPADFFKKGDTIRAVVLRVEMQEEVLVSSYRAQHRCISNACLNWKYRKCLMDLLRLKILYESQVKEPRWLLNRMTTE